MNLAPQGLGMLLTSGYLNDASIFYCASSDNMPGDYQRDGLYRLADWHEAGGLDAETLHYGDWNQRRLFSNYGQWVYGHYNYRCTQTAVMNPWHVWQDGNYPLVGTKPATGVRIGQPYFRSTRELGRRALACDTFSKGMSYDVNGVQVEDLYHGTDIGNSRLIAGYGLKGHREGYNTLYGDGHAEWFGDPQQSFIWHTQGRRDRTYAKTIYIISANRFYGKGGFTSMNSYHYGEGAENTYFKHTGLAMWLELDRNAGVDLPAED
jgi:prepilin-type processing-associated H-X9-DG protein